MCDHKWVVKSADVAIGTITVECEYCGAVGEVAKVPEYILEDIGRSWIVEKGLLLWDRYMILSYPVEVMERVPSQFEEFLNKLP